MYFHCFLVGPLAVVSGQDLLAIYFKKSVELQCAEHNKAICVIDLLCLLNTERNVPGVFSSITTYCTYGIVQRQCIYTCTSMFYTKFGFEPS